MIIIVCFYACIFDDYMYMNNTKSFITFIDLSFSFSQNVDFKNLQNAHGPKYFIYNYKTCHVPLLKGSSHNYDLILY